jgi:hypothetical protein
VNVGRENDPDFGGLFDALMLKQLITVITGQRALQSR